MASNGAAVPIEDEEFFNVINEQIEEAMEQGDIDQAKFVTEQSLGEIWSPVRLKQFCRIAKFEDLGDLDSNKTVETLKHKLLKTISILVRIGWPKWNRFDHIFFNTRYSADGELQRVDSNIGLFKLEDLAKDDFLGGTIWARDFVRIRFAFIPIDIEEGMVQLFSSGHRLPFLEPEAQREELGIGSYGRVTKATIAKWKYHSGGNPVPVSCRAINSQKPLTSERTLT